ncbi:homeodomain-only protein isoform X1 [Marmota marmota marmota]|uniref:homeodomain-only protein isoform X1 n=1 Tax=Marmota marmota marmota TaxID=9994 RepID=UPI002091F3B0|nr:homeodomain-only protein isoform X1 [Marmota marmota marmota]XP_048640496.1 homeodomain-only protein isoform X1 [Marmota marmota marmota]XP_048640498.1 homeodomain-only protein isoform X1 [Marmota marmota marmota]
MSAETASGPTEDQVEILEYNFNKVNKHPDPTTLCLIAAEAGLSEEETQPGINSVLPLGWEPRRSPALVSISLAAWYPLRAVAGDLQEHQFSKGMSQLEGTLEFSNKFSPQIWQMRKLRPRGRELLGWQGSLRVFSSPQHAPLSCKTEIVPSQANLAQIFFFLIPWF